MYVLGSSIHFPNPLNVSGFNPLAIGGDLSIERLICAYSNGIFPWQDNPIVWYSPDPRAILFPKDFILRKSLIKSIKNKGFALKIDENFPLVMKKCQKIKRREDSQSWISNNFIESYSMLFELNLAHSFEVYLDNVLVGGLYGISLGSVFMGESMFAEVSDASKVALFYLVQFCKKYNFDFIDAQVQNSHLASLGVKEIRKTKYLKMLYKSLKNPTMQQSWSEFANFLC